MTETRDAYSNLVSQYFSFGQTISGSLYYLVRDHLGSVTGMTDSGGIIRSSYSYDLFGRRTETQGSINSDFQYAGYYLHSPSGLHLTLTRPYRSDLGRWMSRDTIEEAAGNNLYSYVNNAAPDFSDPMGMDGFGAVIGGIGGGIVGGLGGAIVGGFGGTLVEPVGGTAVGIGFGWRQGAAAGAAYGFAWGAQNINLPAGGCVLMAKSQRGVQSPRNYLTEAAKKEDDPCKFLQDKLQEAKATGDAKLLLEVGKALKYLGCKPSRQTKDKITKKPNNS